MSHPSQSYRAEIEVAASRYGLDPDLVEAIVRTESSGNADAFRHEPAFYQTYLADDPAYDGAIPRRVSSSYGLMQIMYPTARDHGFREPPEYLFVPTINLEWGCRIFAFLLRKAKGNLDKAIVAYNGGMGAWRHNPFLPQHHRYLSKVDTHLLAIKGR